MTPEGSFVTCEGLQSSGYQSQNNQSPLDISQSHSINTVPSIRDFIISEDLLAGQRLDGRMSNVRRFFCLFVTFDFLFISLMWLICVMLDGKGIFKALNEQIVHYNIYTSLFDIVLVAFCRFLLLIFFYAILYVNHWILIALSTSLSCAFLIGKVFMFDWPHSSQPMFEVLLVLVSFVLSWGEAWFLDFRVIPWETQANRYLINSTESERAPLIRSYVQNLPSLYTESVGNFYSPVATPEGSLNQFEPQSAIYPQALLSREQEELHKHLGARTLQTAWDLFQKTDWKIERKQDQDVVYSRKDSKAAKMFKLVAEVNTSPRFLFDELYYKVQNLAEWNTALKEAYKIQVIDEHTDINYHVSAVGAGGLVSSRDFVSLRRWARIDDCYIIAYVKTDHPSLPISSKFVRGENGVCCTVTQSVPNEEGKCRLIWIFNSNLNINIPKLVLEKELIKMMFTYARDLRLHISKKGEIKKD